MNTSTDTTVAGGQAVLRMIPLADIGPCPTNPRATIDPATIAELAASIKVQGVLQPILVRLATQGHQACEIVAGHRRFAAAKLAGLTEMPAIVRALSDVEVLRVQLIENLQREGLHEMEEGEGYQRLMRDHSYSARQIADEVGKSIEYIYARVKLCALSPECRQAFRDGKLSASTAVLVARIPSDKLQLEAMQDITGANNRYTHDVMSHRSALRHIQERYMLSLEKAPFDTRASRYFLTKKDKEPLPSCYECPKRTGACPELFTDVKSPDTCTDPTCFTAKRDGEHAHLVAEAERKGKTVITGKAAKEIFPSSWNRSPANGYMSADDYVGNTGKQLKDLVPKEHMPDFVLVQNPHDKSKLIKLFEPTALAEAFEKVGIKTSSAESGAQRHDKKGAAALAQAKLDAEIRGEIVAALRARMKEEIAACGGLPFEDTVRSIALMMMADADYDAVDSMLLARGIDVKEFDEADATRKLVEEATLPDLFLLMWEGTLQHTKHPAHDRKNDVLLREADRLKVDAITITTRVKLAAKAREKAAAAAKNGAAAPKSEQEKPAKVGKAARKADFMKPCKPDAALAAITGEGPMPRTDVTSRVWAYIKKHGLQDKVNKRMINADEKLKAVFDGAASLTMFDMTKAIAAHLVPDHG